MLKIDQVSKYFLKLSVKVYSLGHNLFQSEMFVKILYLPLNLKSYIRNSRNTLLKPQFFCFFRGIKSNR